MENRDSWSYRFTSSARDHRDQNPAYKHDSGTIRNPRSGLRRYMLLKYLQVLVFPQDSEALLLLAFLASVYTVLLLHSPRVSCKASAVLLRQLAWADVLLLTPRWPLAALGFPFAHRLLSAGRLASMLLLSLLSAEALLVARWPHGSRRVRTASGARLAAVAVWALVLVELMGMGTCPHLVLATGCLRGALWLTNTWVYYTLLHKDPRRKESRFH